MPRKQLLESVSVRTVLQLRPAERTALGELVQATGAFPARVVGALVMRAARALQAGATWDAVLGWIDAAGVQAANYFAAEAQGASPTAEPSESVAGDATDRLTDRPCGGFA